MCFTHSNMLNILVLFVITRLVYSSSAQSAGHLMSHKINSFLFGNAGNITSNQTTLSSSSDLPTLRMVLLGLAILVCVCLVVFCLFVCVIWCQPPREVISNKDVSFWFDSSGKGSKKSAKQTKRFSTKSNKYFSTMKNQSAKSKSAKSKSNKFKSAKSKSNKSRKFAKQKGNSSKSRSRGR